MADTNGYGDVYVPYQGGFTIEEFIDQIQTELTIACALPKTLPDEAIRVIIERRALPWFLFDNNRCKPWFLSRLFTLEFFGGSISFNFYFSNE